MIQIRVLVKGKLIHASEYPKKRSKYYPLEYPEPCTGIQAKICWILVRKDYIYCLQLSALLPQ